jgi:hypothetical protein
MFCEYYVSCYGGKVELQLWTESLDDINDSIDDSVSITLSPDLAKELAEEIISELEKVELEEATLKKEAQL